MRNILCLFFILLTTLASNAKAAESEFVKKALQMQLQQDPYWLKLLHYENAKSIINNQEFFISPDGNTDPKQELIQTITQFEETPLLTCQYPARYKWLNKKVSLAIPIQECVELKEFLKPNFKKLHVLFTSERYNSPSSIFGHTIIKLESDTVPYVIDYSAKVPDGLNEFAYAYRGITGKYKSKYTLMAYYMKDFEYRSEEFRDLIDFSLNFTEDEIENILFHLFEVKNTDQDYYFLSRNCSSELIKLVDLARSDSDLQSDLQSVTTPISIVYILQKHGLISGVSKQISKLKLFYKNVQMLNTKELAVLSKITNNQYSINKFDADLEITHKSKQLIILAAIKYFEIKSIQGRLEQKNIYQLIKLSELQIKYNIESDFDKEITLKRNPVSGKLHKFYVSTKHTQGQSNEVAVGYRHLYRHRFDLMDDEKKSGSVEVFDIALRNKNNSLSLEHLTLLNLEAMPTSNMFFKETTNKITIGAKRLFYDDKLYTYLNYGLGYKYIFNEDIDYSVFAKAGVYYNDEALFLASFESSLEYSLSNVFIAELILQYDSYTNGLQEKSVALNNYIKLSANTTLNISLTHKEERKKYDEIVLKYNINF